MPAALSIDDRVLGYTLGLGDLQQPAEICHGYANACLCSECLERAERVRELQANPIRQPWQPKEAA